MKNLVFVYGTLLRGENNHHYLSRAAYVADAYLEGYMMYNVGSYPAIQKGNGVVVGEVYEVESFDALDRLEGEGWLYKRVQVEVQNLTNTYTAWTYVYLERVDCLSPIGDYIHSWIPRDYVWYVCYGSNLNFDRFQYYILGGKDNKYSTNASSKCNENDRLPVYARNITLDHPIYFAMRSRGWDNSGVAFLDTQSEGHSICRAYLIERNQIANLRINEGLTWYDLQYELPLIDGLEAFTITSTNKHRYVLPGTKYISCIQEGLMQMGYDSIEAAKYIKAIICDMESDSKNWE